LYIQVVLFMQKERFWLLVSLKLSGEATEEELDELHGLLRQFPELNLQLEALDKIWQQKCQYVYPDTNDAYNKHLQRLSNHLAKPVLEYEQAPVGESSELAKATTPLKHLYRRYYVWSGAIAASLIFVFIGIYKSKTFPGPNRSI